MAASKSPKNGKPKKARKKSAEVEAKPKKLSALDAAAQVLAETDQPMACKVKRDSSSFAYLGAGR